MRIRRIIVSLFLCTAIAAAALPAFALSGSDIHDVYRYNIGVCARCTSTINSSLAKAELDLSYLPDPTNHLPEDDYSVIAEVDITIGNTTYQFKPPHVAGMHTSTTITDLSSDVTAISCKYYLNNDNVSFYHYDV